MYNYFAVSSGKLCPKDWHVPTDDQWTILENYLFNNKYNYDITSTEDKYAKALASSSNWNSSSNAGAVGNTDYPAMINITGFSAVPGGTRSYTGTFSDINFSIGSYGFWWSSTEIQSNYAWYRSIYSGFADVYRGNCNKKFGISVRCIHD